jgi:hypothetical protein
VIIPPFGYAGTREVVAGVAAVVGVLILFCSVGAFELCRSGVICEKTIVVKPCPQR